MFNKLFTLITLSLSLSALADLSCKPGFKEHTSGGTCALEAKVSRYIYMDDHGPMMYCEGTCVEKKVSRLPRGLCPVGEELCTNRDKKSTIQCKPNFTGTVHGETKCNFTDRGGKCKTDCAANIAKKCNQKGGKLKGHWFCQGARSLGDIFSGANASPSAEEEDAVNEIESNFIDIQNLFYQDGDSE